ncbi:MAG: UDP-glucose 4-epimerase GalE [Elusimicrobia bacterium RIFOXYB2_FULL_49_7]|nr:MAG: UDP-glucose 4-epimerase GalE [Elusimicrobia bacterium RIFOXYB2_FULL_49_7]
MSLSVLVVGGAGYIGSHCAKLLHQRGFSVTTYDNLSRGFRDAVRYGAFVEGDIGDSARLNRLFRSEKIDAVMHFAAYAYVGESVAQPALYRENNYEKTVRLLEVMLENGIHRFIFSSTCATYGVPQRVPISEEHPQAPINPYGESKLLVEQRLAELTASQGLQSVIFRYFNAAGCDPDGELGERHHPESHLIPLCLRAAAGTGEPLTVFGTDYPTPDGTCIRDYIHVNDLSNAHILGLSYLMDNGRSEVFNLGNGNGFSVRDVIKDVERISGQPVPCQEGPRRAGDPPVLVGNADKAKRMLNWKTEFPELSAIVRTAYRFEQRAR